MSCRSLGNRLTRPFSLALLSLLFAAASARAADIVVSTAKIEAGRLRITGTTTTAAMRVRLDGQTTAAFNVMSSTAKVFSFNLVYHPGDCIVALQKLTPPSTLGAATYAVVAGCGPRGLVPRGAWVATTPYRTNDLVASLGSSWIAKRDNVSKFPTASPTYWEKFASKGDAGAAGARGAQGPTGPQGPKGAAGPQGPQGLQGPQGPQGQQGPAGAAGQNGASGIVRTERLSASSSPLERNLSIRFVGQVAEIAIMAGQHFTGFVTVPVSPSGATDLEFNLCYKSLEATDLQPFGGDTSNIQIQVTTPTMLAVASTVAPSQPGTYQVGFCAINTLDATLGVLSGWIQVTN